MLPMLSRSVGTCDACGERRVLVPCEQVAREDGAQLCARCHDAWHAEAEDDADGRARDALDVWYSEALLTTIH